MLLVPARASADLHEAELPRVPDEEIRGEAADVAHEHGARHATPSSMWSRAKPPGVGGVDDEPVVPEQRGDARAVDRPRGARHGRAPLRAQVGPREGARDALQVALERAGVAHQRVAERGRLRVLGVRVARHQGVSVLLGAGEHRAQQRDEVARHLEQQVAHPQALGGAALVVAAAPRLQTPGDVLAGARGEIALGLGQVGADLRVPREGGEAPLEDVEQAGEQARAPLARDTMPSSTSMTAWARSASAYSRARRLSRGRWGISSYSISVVLRAPRRACSRNGSLSVPLIASSPRPPPRTGRRGSRRGSSSASGDRSSG